MAKSKHIDRTFWKDYTIGFYAGMSSGISIIIWQELTKNVKSFICRTTLLIFLLILTYGVIGLFGQFVYRGFKGNK